MENSEVIELIINKTQIASYSVVATVKLFDEGNDSIYCTL